MVTCELCGRRHDGEHAPLTWATSVERGRTRWMCDRCAREHARAIEARLDSEWF